MPFYVIAQHSNGTILPICHCRTVRRYTPDPLMEFADESQAQAKVDRLNAGLHAMAPMKYAVATELSVRPT